MSPFPTIEARLRDRALRHELSAVGVADLSSPPALAAIVEQGDAWVTGFPVGISLLWRVQDAIVDELPGGHRLPSVARLYDHHVYQVVNGRLDAAALSLAGELQRDGYAALPLPASQTIDQQRFSSHLSHKLVAHLAGLGRIGRSCLLLTPGAGPRVRLATVLTDAPLDPFALRLWGDEDAAGPRGPAGPDVADTCDSCRRCVEACPAGAFTGRLFDPSEPREARMDVHACEAYRQSVKPEAGVPALGLCVAVCPAGRPRPRREYC